VQEASISLLFGIVQAGAGPVFYCIAPPDEF
jgi:hypothetical protein